MSSALVLTLITHMVRVGSLSVDDIDQMADSLEREGDEEAAMQIRGAWAEAQAMDPAEWARSRFRVLDGGNGQD